MCFSVLTLVTFMNMNGITPTEHQNIPNMITARTPEKRETLFFAKAEDGLTICLIQEGEHA
jgi:hypothetical protein